MAGSVNKVILVGNLGKDPEIRRTQDGRPIANLSVATSDSWRDKATGERKEKTEWHRVVIFNEGLCKVAEQYLKKGAKVYIEGALQTRKWTDASGVEKYSTEVVLQGFNSTLTMLDGRSGGGGGNFGGSDDAGRVGPFAGLQRALDVNLGALLEILLDDLAQRLGEDHHPMPLGLFLALAGRLVAPGIGRRHAQIGNRPPILRPPDLGILAEVSDQNHLVHASRHRRSPLSKILGWPARSPVGLDYRHQPP